MKNTEAGLKFWLGMIGCMTFWDIDEEIWLRRLVRDVVEECNVSSWKDVKEILRGFLWIGILDDEVGKGVYERVTREGFL